MSSDSQESLVEYAFDGLVGPTHHYAGLSHGNLASTEHAGQVGNPRAAALQGLAKVRRVAALGAARAVLPPHERPYLPLLRQLGFGGSDAAVLDAVHRQAPALLSTASSASAMWAANMATVTPSPESGDGRAHFTPANLSSMLHRSLEAATAARLLTRLFADESRFAVHAPLPAHASYSDEGAANHTRLATHRGVVHLFGWGRSLDAALAPSRFPARQARAACEAVQRLHGLSAATSLLWQQSPEGIDAGAFHSDVLAVGSGCTWLMHEHAFVESERLLQSLRARLGEELEVLVASDAELPLKHAVACYPFNSELVPLPNGKLVLLAPRESEQNLAAHAFLERVREQSSFVEDVVYVDVNDSMRNGGGPACLRLRVQLTAEERASVAPRVFFDSELDAALTRWIERSYRDRLVTDDLRDPELLVESRTALDELCTLLGLGSLYDFQRA
jgi:succinylarginine dihydrolase